MMKRLVSFLVVTVLCFAALFVQGASVLAVSSEATFFLSCTEGKVGDTVTVTVNITGDSGFTNATVYLHYNAEIVKFQKEGTGELVSANNGMFMVKDEPSLGYVKGGYIGLYPAVDAGTLFTYQFKVLKDKAAGFSLTFDECQGEDENGNMFDINYSTTTCVLNEEAGGAVDTTSSGKPNNSTKATTTPKNTTTKTGAQSQNGTSTATEPTTVTYPTDAHGITLAPHVVTEADGNAATNPDGEVVTMTTTTTTSVLSDATGEPTEVPSEATSNTVMPIVIGGVLLLVAGGVTAVMLIARKKKANH